MAYRDAHWKKEVGLDVVTWKNLLVTQLREKNKLPKSVYYNPMTGKLYQQKHLKDDHTRELLVAWEEGREVNVGGGERGSLGGIFNF